MPAAPLPVGSRPPIRVWLLALVLAGLTVFLLSRSWVMERLVFTPPVPDFNVTRLHASSGPGLHVVALGTSKTREALPFDNDFPEVQSQSGKAVRFQRFSAGGTGFSSFAPVLAALLETPPDVLLLESDLLLYDRKEQFEGNLLDAFRASLLNVAIHVRNGLFPRKPENYGFDKPASAASCLASRTPEQINRYVLRSSSWTPTTEVQRQDAIQVLRRLKQRGTFIVLLDLPRAPYASRLVPQGLDLQVGALRKQLQAQEGFAFWSPGVLEDGLYCDQGHLNPNGRQVYTQWLSRQLAGFRLGKGQP